MFSFKEKFFFDFYPASPNKLREYLTECFDIGEIFHFLLFNLAKSRGLSTPSLGSFDLFDNQTDY